MHPNATNSMTVSGLSYRNDLVGAGRGISILLGINGVRNKLSHLVGPPFHAMQFVCYPSAVGPVVVSA